MSDKFALEFECRACGFGGQSNIAIVRKTGIPTSLMQCYTPLRKLRFKRMNLILLPKSKHICPPRSIIKFVGDFATRHWAVLFFNYGRKILDEALFR